MEKVFVEALRQFGALELAGLIVGFVVVVAVIAYWLCEPGKPVKVLFGLAEFTKPDRRARNGSYHALSGENVRQVQVLPPATTGPVELVKDVSIFDLRSWQPVRVNEPNACVRSTTLLNFLHLRKTKSIDQYVAHFATTGAGMELRCITHKYEVTKSATIEQGGKHRYAITIDVTPEPVGEREFLVVLEATLWNNFRDPEHGDAATYAESDIAADAELALIVLFPASKPFKALRRTAHLRGNKAEAYRGVDLFFEDRNRGYAYWSVRERQPDHTYKLEWDW